MNVLFLTMGSFESIEAHSIYADLLRCFRNHGHNIFVIAPETKSTNQSMKVVLEKGACVLHVDTKDARASKNLIKKGLSQIRIEPLYLNAIKQYFKNVKFDLVLYSTPPITFYKVVKYIKKRDGAKTYLLLKDIFPQNAVDLGMMKKSGISAGIYKFFRKKEKKLYNISDHIGCMSKANVDYVITHNSTVAAGKVEECPNSIEIVDKSISKMKRDAIRKKYDIPLDKIVFIYGGNLGKPQGIPFLIECLQKTENDKVFFLIVGGGSEYGLLKKYIDNDKPQNVRLMASLPKDDYDTMVGACDVGLLFLDHRFTIPNFPSRLLAYMQAGIPVLACTDSHTDVGEVIQEGQFGWWCESDSWKVFAQKVNEICVDDRIDKGKNGYYYLCKYYSVEQAYNTICVHFDCDA